MVERRAAWAFMTSREVSGRRACWWLGLSRSWVGYVSVRGDDDDGLCERLKDLAKAHPRYGVRRLCRELGLLLKQRRRRKRRGIGAGVSCRAERPGQVWAYDFVEDRTVSGMRLRILTVIDPFDSAQGWFTRECIALETEYRMGAAFVASTLLTAFGRRGAPEFVRSDNGPEFIAKHLTRWPVPACRRGTSSRAARGRTVGTSGSTGACGTSV
jgi:putative transposase